MSGLLVVSSQVEKLDAVLVCDGQGRVECAARRRRGLAVTKTKVKNEI